MSNAVAVAASPAENVIMENVEAFDEEEVKQLKSEISELPIVENPTLLGASNAINKNVSVKDRL